MESMMGAVMEDSNVTRVVEFADELLKAFAEKSLVLARDISVNGRNREYWVQIGSYWAEILNNYAFLAATTVAHPLNDRAWMSEMSGKALDSVGLSPERLALAQASVAPYAAQAQDFVVPFVTRILDTAAVLLEGTPWWVLWLALLVSMPGGLSGWRRPTAAAEEKAQAEPRGRGTGVLGVLVLLLAGLAAAAAVVCLHAPPAAYLQLTLPVQSALLTAALSVGMISWILIVVGAVSLPWQLRLPVAAVLPAGLAWHFLMPEAAFCAARSQCRDVVPDDVKLALQRRARNQELLAGPHQRLSATVRALARTKPRHVGASSRAVVLAVGAHELKEDLADFAALMALSPQVILVEPNSKHIPGLKRSLAMIDAPPKHTNIITAAVCASDKKGVSFYTSETAATRDSLDKHYVAKYSDMKEKKVKCMTVPSVLTSANIVAKDLDIVILDAEGSDLSILEGLLRLPNFVPRLVRFPCCFGWESRGIPTGLAPAMSTLAGRGYDIYLDGDDMLAVHESVSEDSEGAAGFYR